jgi:exonuclease SbcC
MPVVTVNMSNLTFRDTSLDKFDKRILLALEDDVLSAKQICSEWAMPDDYASRVRYRIREQLGQGEGRLVQIYADDETPGAIHNRNLYALTEDGEAFVRANYEALQTPEDIDALVKRVESVDDRAVHARQKAEDVEETAERQRERVNNLQRDYHKVNERSKESRKRLRKIENEVFETEWEPPLSQLIDEVAEGSRRRDENIEHDLDVLNQTLRRELVSRSDFRPVERQAQKAWNWVRSMADRVNALESKLEEEQERREQLERRVATLEREIDTPSGLRGLFY